MTKTGHCFTVRFAVSRSVPEEGSGSEYDSSEGPIGITSELLRKTENKPTMMKDVVSCQHLENLSTAASPSFPSHVPVLARAKCLHLGGTRSRPPSPLPSRGPAFANRACSVIMVCLVLSRSCAKNSERRHEYPMDNTSGSFVD